MPGLRASLKGLLRRQSDLLFPNRETREYRRWIAGRLSYRALLYNQPIDPGLLSILTPVWDGSPLRYLEALASAVVAQNQSGACEWVLLDNGCARRPLLEFFQGLRAHPWIKLHRLKRNAGIIAGLRSCLERATSRYVMAVDADDLLYPDALRVVATYIQNSNYPSLLYSDEDKVIGSSVYQPYMKPDWDPVLLLNSAYIAHLGILDRREALDLGVYSDPNTEGSPDWDAFIRFLIAGRTAAHIPEVLYSWRVHARSTADDASTKPYVLASQRAVLQRFLDARAASCFHIEHSPLLGGMAHWRLASQRTGSKPFPTVVISREPRPARSLLPASGDLLHLMGDDVQADDSCWWKDAVSLFELHPDIVMIGGRIRDPNGIVTEAGRIFGFAGPCGCPDRGRRFDDPGYFAQMWKQRSVSAVSSQFAVIRASFLIDVLRASPETASLAYLGAWAGARAFRTGKRVAYSPYLSGASNFDWNSLIDPAEESLFAELNRDLIPDHRFYSRNLSLDKPFAFGPFTLRPAIIP
ncbi:MAG: glycosyltransferase [Acidobacteriaceae bacterium]|nr:glycosyltransferase [Acidobacteriaceae bacterium]